MHYLTIKKAIHKKSLIYLRDYFESLSLPSNRLMKHTSMLDLIILHKGEEKKYTAESQVLAWVWEYWLYPSQESEKSLGMVALSLCCVASAQINILSVIVFPQEPQSLKSIFFSFALQNEIQVSVLHKFAAVSKTFLQHI